MAGRLKPTAPATPAPAAAPVATTPAEPAPAEPAPATPPAEPAAPATPPAEPALPDRFRFSDENDRLVALYAKQHKISLIEAARILAPPTPVAPATPATTPGATPPGAPAEPTPDPTLVEFDKQISAADAKIAELTKKRDQLREDMDNAAADKISDEIADLKADKRVLAAEKKAAIERAKQAETAGFESEFNASQERALTQFPVLGDPTSPHYLALQGYIGNLQRNPANAAFFKDPRWPELIAADYAEKYGVAGGAATPAGTTPPATPPAPAPAAPPARQPATITPPKPVQVTASATSGPKMLTSAAGTTPAPSVPTPQEVIAASRTDPKLRAELRKQILTRRAA